MKKASRFFRLEAAIIAGLALSGSASASTVALYTFDTMNDATDEPAGEQIYDSSGNNLHINRVQNFGELRLTQDIRTTGPNPPPAGSLALDQRYTAIADTPSSPRFSVAQTGQLSIEFWWKPVIADTIRYILCTPGTGGSPAKNSWGLYQSVPNESGKYAVKAYFYDADLNPASFPELSTGDIFDSDFITAVNPQWHHIAVTFDATQTGRMYLDGSLVSTQNWAGANHTVIDTPMRVGGSPVAAFVGWYEIDDMRISDVALPAGSGSGVNELAWNTSFSQAPDPGPRPPNLGRMWLRSHPMMISSWGGGHDAAEYAAANFNTAMSNRSGYHTMAAGGIDTQMLGSFIGFDDVVITELQIASNAPRMTSYMIRDEIPEGEIPDIAQQAAYLRSIDSSRIIIAGLGSSGLSYIDNVVTNIQPDALIHGYYPWQGPTSATDDFQGMLEDWVPVRQKALQYNLPAFAFIQSFDDMISSPNPENDRRRLPSESELRAEVFAHLSGGVQGVVYFVADARSSGGVDQALINPDGAHSSLYTPAQQLNAEVARLGRSLRFLTSSDWRFVSGGLSTNPAGLSNWSSGAGSDTKIQSIAVDGTPAAGKDGLIGYFTDDAGQSYFMLTNLNHAQGGSAAATAASFTVTFDSSVNDLLRLNRITGEPEKLVLNNHVLNLTLPGGTGDLLKYSSGFFAGIPGGDANLDGKVDVGDLGILATNWQGSGTWKSADFTFDGVINVGDLGVLATHWQEGVSGGGSQSLAEALVALGLPGVSVPEPAALAVAGAASLLLWRRRQNQ